MDKRPPSTTFDIISQIRAKVLQFKPIGDLAESDETQIRAPSDHNQGTSEHDKRALCVPPQEESASAELDRVMLLWSRLTADEKAQMLIDIEQNGFEST